MKLIKTIGAVMTLAVLAMACDSLQEAAQSQRIKNATWELITDPMTDITPLFARVSATVNCDGFEGYVSEGGRVCEVLFYVSKKKEDPLVTMDDMYAMRASRVLQEIGKSQQISEVIDLNRFEAGQTCYFFAVLVIYDRAAGMKNSLVRIIGEPQPFRTADPSDFIEALEPLQVTESAGTMAGRMNMTGMKRMMDFFPGTELQLRLGFMYSKKRSEVVNAKFGEVYIDCEYDTYYDAKGGKFVPTEEEYYAYSADLDFSLASTWHYRPFVLIEAKLPGEDCFSRDIAVAASTVITMSQPQ